MDFGRQTNKQMQSQWKQLLKTAEVTPGTPELHLFIEMILKLHEDGITGLGHKEIVALAEEYCSPSWCYWVYTGS